MEKVNVIVEKASDGKFSAYMDSDTFDFGLAGFGKNAKEAIADFYEALGEEKVMYEKEGKTFPELDFNVQYDVCSFLDFYSGVLSKSGLEKITGINQKQLWHYFSGNRRPKPQTTKRIIEGLHSFAEEIRQVQFVD
ncbi:DNA-binding protein [Viscerimonas tarda]